MDANETRCSDRTQRIFPAIVRTCFSFVRMHKWHNLQPLRQGSGTGALGLMDVWKP